MTRAAWTQFAEDRVIQRAVKINAGSVGASTCDQSKANLVERSRTGDGSRRPNLASPVQPEVAPGPAPINAGGNTESPVGTPRASAPAPVTLSWPPTGNLAVRHAKGGHYLTKAVADYREGVCLGCWGVKPCKGRYRLFVHLSPPDGRIRDIDNALKTIFDALVHAGYLHSDSMTFMRELHVTVDDKRRGSVRIRTDELESA